jgi:uncharacterized protein (TIGR01244 family)
MSVSDADNFRQVDDHLSTAGVLAEKQIRELAGEGYQAVINLLPEDSPYAVTGEREMIEAQGVAYTYIPVDFAAPTASDYREFVSAMEADADSKLIVHCAANYRVSAFYAIYAANRLGWTRDRAYGFIADIWDLGEHPVWEAFVAEMLENNG